MISNFAENIRDKSPRVTDPKALAAALSNIGTMSPRLRKLYDDSSACFDALAAEIDRFKHNETVLVNALYKACGDDEEIVRQTIESQGDLQCEPTQAT